METASAPAREPDRPGPATVRRRRGSELVAEELLDAALVEFAAHGYTGSSTRAIAERAGCHQPQINYHFSSKELLWQAAVDRLFELLDAEVFDVPFVDTVPAAVLAEVVRRFVRFSARRPELHRIMNLESTVDSAQLDWIVERHVRPRFEQATALWAAVRADGDGADLTPLEVWELLIGVGALPFANAPLLRRLADVDLADPEVVEAHADRLVTQLLPTGTSGSSPRRGRGQPPRNAQG